ncbi:MAG: response regulator, partial [Lachnospiraceae bacterium]|nr:response regulator [Lachnospiraceae bacterium]
MYKILLADDETIVLEALNFIIESRFKNQCEIKCAKTGRGVIELAESFSPDIAIMDIQMPGINGIEAMREIRRVNKNIIFIVMTAYDKFEYARDAIDLGVMEYLSKPVKREKIEEVLLKAMALTDERRKKRSNDLLIKEKLEMVIPFLESGLIYDLLLGKYTGEGIEKYRKLLELNEEYAFIMVCEAFGSEGDTEGGQLGLGVKLEQHYETVRNAFKNWKRCIVGPIMSNSIVIVVPSLKKEVEYGERSVFINDLRILIH